MRGTGQGGGMMLSRPTHLICVWNIDLTASWLKDKTNICSLHRYKYNKKKKKWVHGIGHGDIVLTGDKGVPCAWLMFHCLTASLLLCNCYNRIAHHWAVEDWAENCPGTVILEVVLARGCAKTCFWRLAGTRGLVLLHTNVSTDISSRAL